VRVVIDTNVIVSALINPFGIPSSILSLVLEEKLQTCYDSRILFEYIDVLNRPAFNFDPSEIADLIDFVKDTGFSVIGKKVTLKLKDPDDIPFLEVALSAQAAFLITGNISHFPGKIGETRIVTPSVFIKEIYRD
jgi:putative PIN family toxin of toxin-antitoxin system